jgi:pimeloyl-ACP methyl ester carboxylesterase
MEEHEHRVRVVPLPDGRRLRVRVWPGRGRPLVLLHGLLDDSVGWAPLAQDTRRPAIAIDLPGFGGSDLPTRPRISAYADDIAAAVGRMRLDGCTLVGHSLGGAVAVAVAERTPLIGGLALLAPAGFGPIRLAEAMSMPGVVHVAQAALPFALVSPLHVTAAYATLVAHRRLPSRDLMTRLRRHAFRSAPGVRAATEAIAAAGRSARGFHRRQVDFDGPVAALFGERDALVPLAHVPALRQALPQAHVEIWPDMGHHPQRERPHQLLAFLEAHALRGRRPGNQPTPRLDAVPARCARAVADAA